MKSRLFKGGLVLLVIDLLEQQLEGLVIVLGDGVLGAEPHILPHGQGIGEAAAGEGENGGVPVVHGLHHAGVLEVEHRLAAQLPAAFIGEHQLGFSGTGYAVFHRLVQVAVGVAGDGNGLLPAGHHRLDPLQQDGCAEHGAVQRRPDGGVGRFPQLGQAVLLLALQVGGDGGALHADLQALDGLRCLCGDGICRLLPVGQGQVVVFGVQVHEGLNKCVLYHAPQHMGHLIAVQFGDGDRHFDLFHSVHRLCRVIVDEAPAQQQLALLRVGVFQIEEEVRFSAVV